MAIGARYVGAPLVRRVDSILRLLSLRSMLDISSRKRMAVPMKTGTFGPNAIPAMSGTLGIQALVHIPRTQMTLHTWPTFKATIYPEAPDTPTPGGATVNVKQWSAYRREASRAMSTPMVRRVHALTWRMWHSMAHPQCRRRKVQHRRHTGRGRGVRVRPQTGVALR